MTVRGAWRARAATAPAPAAWAGAARLLAGAAGLVALAAAVAAGGCKKQTPVPTNNLDRPAALAFVCLRDGAPIPPGDCTPPTILSGAASGGTDQLVTLVLNTSRGEVAVVEDRVLVTGSGTNGVDSLRAVLLDSDFSVPEFTFIASGDAPVAMVGATDGLNVYVANAGGCSLGVLDASTVLDGHHDQRLPQIPLPGRPADLVVLPGAAAGGGDLYAVSLPDTATVALVDPAAWDGTPGGSCTAPAAPGAPHIVAIVGPLGMGPGISRPGRLAYDGVAARLYVADEGEPAWHVLDVADPLAPLVADAVAEGRTGALAVSPDGAFLYVADLDHGTLLLYDAAARTLLPDVNDADPYAPFRGVDFPGVIRDIVFFERPSDLGADPAPEDTGPGVLLGTFAALASSNGNVYFMNVDPTYPDRSPAAPTADVDVVRPLQPAHTARNAANDDQAAVGTAPRPFAGGDFLSFDPNSLDPAFPVIATRPDECLTASMPSTDVCYDPAGFNDVHDYGLQLLAGVTDVGVPITANPGAERWTHSETWQITWEGVIGGTRRFAGLLVAPGQIDDPLAAFCAHGVLAGDAVEILDPPTGAACSDDEVEVFSVEERRVFPVTAAADGTLALGPYTDARGGTPVDYPARPECFGNLVAYQVRVVGEYTLTGSASGFLHGVTANMLTGACDPNPDPAGDAGRIPVELVGDIGAGCSHRAAVSNLIFEGALWFDSCGAAAPGPPARDTGWSFGVSSGFARLRLNPVADATGGVNTISNLAALRLAPFPGADELYVVDEGAERITVWSLDEGFALDVGRTIQ
jgi:DNA-binding beta-propeller fold protein YncE